MSGQVAQNGAMATLNALTRNAVPFLGASAPTWVPGLYWINTTSGAVLNYWNGTAWVAGTPSEYVALLVGNPATSGPGGSAAVLISDLQEDTTLGYARQAVTFSPAAAGSPGALSSNTGALTFGPYTANQAAPVSWAALVTAASGNTGLLLYTWQLDTPEQVAFSQPIIIPAGALVLDQI